MGNAQVFIKKLNEKEKTNKYRLPRRQNGNMLLVPVAKQDTTLVIMNQILVNMHGILKTPVRGCQKRVTILDMIKMIG